MIQSKCPTVRASHPINPLRRSVLQQIVKWGASAVAIQSPAAIAVSSER